VRAARQPQRGVTRLLEIFKQTAALLARRMPGLRLVVPIAETVRDLLVPALRDWPAAPVPVFGEAAKLDAMAASNVALAASGTVALELALARVPAVVAYRLALPSYLLIKRLVKVRHVHLLNILAEQAIVPERLQGACRPDLLAADLEPLFGSAGAAQIRALVPPLAALRPPADGAPSDHAAREISKFLIARSDPARAVDPGYSPARQA